MDPFQQSIILSLGRTSHKICPVCMGNSPFLSSSRQQTSLLFILCNDKIWNGEMFGSALDRILTQLHLNKEHFNTCGSRIGVATSAKQAETFDVHWEDGEVIFTWDMDERSQQNWLLGDFFSQSYT